MQRAYNRNDTVRNKCSFLIDCLVCGAVGRYRDGYVSHSGTNRLLIKELCREAEHAAMRIEKHWKKVTEKQILCQQLANQLQQLHDELSRLLGLQSEKESEFLEALEVLRRKNRPYEYAVQQARTLVLEKKNAIFEVSRRSTLLRESSEAVRKAEEVLHKAEAALVAAQRTVQSMEREQHSLTGAFTPEGEALQRAKRHVRQIKDAIAGVRKKLAAAKKPPPPVYQPLPDSRKTDSNALAVLFYTRSHLTGSMLLLQQFCCAAQLAVCAWPLRNADLWDVENALSADALNEAWKKYFQIKANACCYLQQTIPAAEVDRWCTVDMFADFQEPRPTDAVVCFSIPYEHYLSPKNAWSEVCRAGESLRLAYSNFDSAHSAETEQCVRACIPIQSAARSKFSFELPCRWVPRMSLYLPARRTVSGSHQDPGTTPCAGVGVHLLASTRAAILSILFAWGGCLGKLCQQHH
jgi:uncharacterized HAD superfamily protein